MHTLNSTSPETAITADTRFDSGAGWTPSPRYPDPLIRVIDESFSALRLPLSKIERVASGCRWAEGPVWVGDARSLLWSDIPNDRILRWDEESGAVSVFRRPSGYANGATRDRNGRLIHCEHGGRRVVRTEPDGRLTVIAETFEGKRLNSPNDVVCKSDGSIWFTDPSFGILGWYEGGKAAQELPTQVYRLSPEGKLDVVAEGINQPNGLAFPPMNRFSISLNHARYPAGSLPLTFKRPADSLLRSAYLWTRDPKARPTDSGWISKGISGVVGAWASPV